MKNKLQYIHPFLFAIAPAVFLWEYNFAETQIREVITALAASIMFGGIIFAICQLLYRNSRKAAILTSVFLLLTLSHRYIYLNPLIYSFMRHRYGFLISFFIIIILGYKLKKTQKNLVIPTHIFTVIPGIFILLSIFRLGAHLYAGYGYNALPRNEIATATEIKNQEGAKNLPDIYYLIFDEYMAPDVIKKMMDYEKANEINDWLKKQGFFVPKNSKSNYWGTSHSMSSFLNMRYLNAEEFKNTDIRSQMIQNHLIGNILKTYGYRYIHAGADWITYRNSHADENIYFSYSPYQHMLWETTAFFAFIEYEPRGLDKIMGRLGIRSLDPRFAQWEREQLKFAKLAEIPKKKEPTFAYAHFFLPHGPRVFNADGSYITREEESKKTQFDLYTGQVAFANSQIKQLITEILERSKQKPIIIIQADHGYINSASPEPRFQILNAYYFPDGGDKNLYDSISPVNSFRILFNYYFNQNFKLLEDASYMPDPNDDSQFIRLP